MASSLARQLQSVAGADAARLSSARALKQRDSYLFTPRQAATHSLETIHALGQSGFEQLLSIDPRLEKFENDFFSERAKDTDRTQLNKDENDVLDAAIGQFLRALSRHVLVKPAAKVLEWLVRRFRINEFNVEDTLACFLPYHETSQFAQILQILKVESIPHLSLLVATKKTLQPLPRPVLIKAIVNSPPLLSFVTNLLPKSNAEQNAHRALIAFWMSTLMASLSARADGSGKGKAKDGLVTPEDVSTLLPAILTAAKAKRDPEIQIAGYLLLGSLAQKTSFDQDPLSKIVTSMAQSGVDPQNATDDVRAPGDIHRERDEALITTMAIVCQSQKELDAFSPKAISNIAKIPRIEEILIGLGTTYNVERFFRPLVKTLSREGLKHDHFLGLLRSILQVTDRTLPEASIRIVCTVLVDTSLDVAKKTEQGLNSVRPILKVLENIYQRSPKLLDEAMAGKIEKGTDEDREWIKRLLNALANGHLDESVDDSFSPLVATMAGGDVSSNRLLMLKELLKRAQEGQIVEEQSQESLRRTLLGALTESEPASVSTIFASPEIILSALSSEQIFSTCLKALSSDQLKRSTVLQHVAFLVGPFLQAHPQFSKDVLFKALWSKLPITKQGRKTAVAVWGALQAGSAIATSPQGLLKGIEKIRVEGLEEGDSATASKANSDIAEVLSANFARHSSTLDENIDTLFLVLHPTVESETPATSSMLLAGLVLVRLLPELEVNRRVHLAGRIVKALTAGAIEWERPGAQANGTLPDELMNAVYAKTSSTRTIQKVRGSLLESILSTLESRPEATFTWFSAIDGDDVRTYKELCMGIYSIMHRNPTDPVASLAAGALFGRALTVDALAFLAGAVVSSKRLPQLRICALNDARQLIEVYADKGLNKVVDFQTIVPSLLVAMSDERRAVRERALAVLESIQKSTTKSDEADEIYGMDALYGTSSSDLQYLPYKDAKQFVSLLLEAKGEITLDPNSVIAVHASLSDTKSGRSKKHGIVFFLASHIIALSDLDARTQLLRVIHAIRDAAKVKSLSPLIKAAIRKGTSPREDHLLANAPEETRLAYLDALFSVLDRPSRSLIEDKDSDLLPTFLSAIELDASDNISRAVKRAALRRLVDSLFPSLREGQRLDALRSLVRQVVHGDTASEVRTLLRALRLDSVTLSEYFHEVIRSLGGSPTKGAKRARGAGGPTAIEDLSELTAALESIKTGVDEPASGKLQVLGSLFDLLANLVSASASTQVNVQYLGQLVMSHMTTVLATLKEDTSATSTLGGVVRVSTILDLIRVSNNPQTSHQALLLVADIAPLFPDQVVQNVLPIFTFMGTNLLQRDDSYSIQVVERTIESIIPALTASIKKSATDRNQVVAGLRDLVQVFTDAAMHVPRHRRLRLFVRFVQAMGPSDILSTVAMLLINKSTSKILHADPGHVPDVLNLPLSILEHFAPTLQLAASGELLREALAELALEDAAGPQAASGSPAPSDDSVSSPARLRRILAVCRTITAALVSPTFGARVGSARMQPSSPIDVNLRAILDLSLQARAYLVPISTASYGVSVVDQLMLAVSDHMSLEAFAKAVVDLSGSTEDETVLQISSLYRAKVTSVVPDRRHEMHHATQSILSRTTQDLKGFTAAGRRRTFHLLASSELVASIAEPDDMESLANLYLAILQWIEDTSIRTQEELGHAFAALKAMTPTLGSRLIPWLQRTVAICLEYIERFSAVTQEPVATSGPVLANILQSLTGLLISVPTFLASHLQRILRGLLRLLPAIPSKGPSTQKAATGLFTTVVKKVPARTLVPALSAIWGDRAVSDSFQATRQVIALLDSSLKKTSNAELADVSKVVFRFLLNVFDVRRDSAQKFSVQDIGIAEQLAIDAFLRMGLRLSENVFKPMFLRLYDWAVIDVPDSSRAQTLAARRVVLFRVMNSLIQQLESIAVPYFGFLFDQALEVLEAYATGDIRETILWDFVVRSAQGALLNDAGGFWTPARLQRAVPPVIGQLHSPSGLPPHRIASLISDVASAAAPHEAVLKSLNSALLSATRREAAREKVVALQALEAVWERLQDAMLPFVPETVPFLVECLESTEADVEPKTRSLISRIETHLGESLDTYLQ